MAFHRIEPTRPGNVWQRSSFKPGTRDIERMVFSWDFWSGEPLFHDVPYLFVRRSVGEALANSGLTGFSLREVETGKSAEWDASAGHPEPEPVMQLEVHGQHGADDFGMQNKVDLVLSDRALDLLKAHGLRRSDLFPYEPERKPLTMEEFWALKEGTSAKTEE